MPLPTTAKIFPPLLLLAVSVAAYQLYDSEVASVENHVAQMAGEEAVASAVLVTHTRQLVNQGAISDLTPTEVKALIDTLSNSSLVLTEHGYGLYNADHGTTSYGSIYHDGFPIDPRSVALAVYDVVKEQRAMVEKRIGQTKNVSGKTESKTVGAESQEKAKTAVSSLPESDVYGLGLEKSQSIPTMGSASIVDGKIKLSPEQNQRYIAMMNAYLKDRGMGDQPSGAQGHAPIAPSPSRSAAPAPSSPSPESLSSATSSMAAQGQRTPSGSAGGLSKTQINVSQLSETQTGLYYKGTLLPKVGYDSEGKPVGRQIKAEQVKVMLERIKQAGDSWSILYPAEGPVKRTIAIFGDPGCPVCQKLHRYIPDLQRAGVEIYYLFYNRQLSPHTVGSPRAEATNTTMKNIWCAADSASALDHAYGNRGQYNEFTDCSTLSAQGKSEFPGDAHFLMGRLINMEGTPYAITDEGEIVNGFATRGASQPMTYLRRLGL